MAGWIASLQGRLIAPALATALLVPQLSLASDEVVRSPDAATPEATVQRVLQAGLDGDFAAYLREVHPDRAANEDQQGQLRRYEWARLMKQAQWYIVQPKPLTFHIGRRQQISKTKLKLFVRDQAHPESMPRPVELTERGGKWLVSANSL